MQIQCRVNFVLLQFMRSAFVLPVYVAAALSGKGGGVSGSLRRANSTSCATVRPEFHTVAVCVTLK